MRIFYIGVKPTFKGRVNLFQCVNDHNRWDRGNGLCDGEIKNWQLQKVRPVKIRYSKNHIGLGTKRFVDSLGGC